MIFLYFFKHATFSTGTTRQIDVDSISILPRFVEKKIWTNFPVALTYFFDVISTSEKSTSFQRTFRRNFDVRKIHIVSTYSVRRNIDEQKVDVISIYFLRRNFVGCKINIILMSFWCTRNNFGWLEVNVFSMYYFNAILMNWKLTQLWHANSDIYTSMEIIRGGTRFQ